MDPVSGGQNQILLEDLVHGVVSPLRAERKSRKDDAGEEPYPNGMVLC